MKVGIVCFWDRRATPYLWKYESALTAAEIEYDVVFWERDGESHPDSSHDEKSIRIVCGKKRLGKIISFFRWRLDMAALIRQQKYDYLIVLTTYPAVLLTDILLTRYRGRYIFDIRDYTHEKQSAYRKLVMRLIDASCFAAISSRGFLTWLDASDKIILNHNMTVSGHQQHRELVLRSSIPIHLSFVGNVRLDNQTRTLLLALANNPRFEMSFWGRILPGCDIVEFCAKHEIRNVRFEGEFSANDKERIYEKVDLVNAVYANNSEGRLEPGDSTPLPNRLYDAIVFRRPIVASKGTYLARLVDQYHLGFSLGFDSDVEREIEKYIADFCWDEFCRGCAELLALVLAEEGDFQKKLHVTLESWRRRQSGGTDSSGTNVIATPEENGTWT